MDTSRRTLMTAIGLGGTAIAGVTGTAMAKPAATEGRLVHHVFFWLNNPASAADRDQVIAGLRKLAKIDVIRGLHIGTPAPTEQRDVVDASFDVSELMFFDNAADQKIYQDHPLHQAFITSCGHLWRKVVVYDAIAA